MLQTCQIVFPIVPKCPKMSNSDASFLSNGLVLHTAGDQMFVIDGEDLTTVEIETLVKRLKNELHHKDQQLQQQSGITIRQGSW